MIGGGRRFQLVIRGKNIVYTDRVDVEGRFAPSCLNERVSSEVFFESVDLANLEEDDSHVDEHLFNEFRSFPRQQSNTRTHAGDNNSALLIRRKDILKTDEEKTRSGTQKSKYGANFSNQQFHHDALKLNELLF